MRLISPIPITSAVINALCVRSIVKPMYGFLRREEAILDSWLEKHNLVRGNWSGRRLRFGGRVLLLQGAMRASLVVSLAAARLFAPLARDAAPPRSAGGIFRTGQVAAASEARALQVALRPTYGPVRTAQRAQAS